MPRPNQFPIYIPTKGRFEYMITAKALDIMGIQYRLIIEEQEYENYLKAVNKDKKKLIVMDQSYKEKYELCDNLGLSKSTGPGPARNCAWDHAISEGYEYHWVMDDNIKSFFRYNKNLKVPCTSPSFWKAMEDFCLRYENVTMAGPNYFFFCSRKNKMPPFVINTRIYSCNFIKNNTPFRWRGRYNEDTILSLDMLKAGFCTIQFNAFLQDKMETQKVKGGNTGEFYHKEGKKEEGKKYTDKGTLAKSLIQVKVHPDVSELVWKFGRWHHKVDYKPFKANKLIRKSKPKIKKGINNYGMSLRKVIKKKPKS